MADPAASAGSAVAADGPPLAMLCSVCDVASSTCCSVCKSAYYCCKAHQRQDWPQHKLVCFAPPIRLSTRVGPDDIQYLVAVAARTLEAGEYHHVFASGGGAHAGEALPVAGLEPDGTVVHTQPDGAPIVLYKFHYKRLVASPSWRELKKAAAAGSVIISMSTLMILGAVKRPEGATGGPFDNVKMV